MSTVNVPAPDVVANYEKAVRRIKNGIDLYFPAELRVDSIALITVLIDQARSFGRVDTLKKFEQEMEQQIEQIRSKQRN